MGLLDDISGLLSNPAVQTLLPTALGAAGGALGSPRMAGTRGAIANGLLGGAQGFAQGAQTVNQTANAQSNTQRTANETALLPQEQAELAARTQYLQGQKAQQDMILKDEQSRAAYGASLTDPAKKAEYLADPATYFQRDRLEKEKPANILFLKGHGYADTAALQGLDSAQLSGMVQQVAKAQADGLNPKVLDTDQGAVLLTVDPTNPAKFTMNPLGVSLRKESAPKFQAVPLEGGGIGAFDASTGKVVDTGARGVPKATGKSPVELVSTEIGRYAKAGYVYDSVDANDNVTLKKPGLGSIVGMDKPIVVHIEGASKLAPADLEGSVKKASATGTGLPDGVPPPPSGFRVVGGPSGTTGGGL